MLTHIHTHAHTQKQNKKAKSLATTKRTCQLSEALGCLGTTQVLRASAGKSTWGRAITLQVGLYHAQGDGVGTLNLSRATPISRHVQQFDICLPSYYEVPIDITAGWAASLDNTTFPFIHTHSLTPYVRSYTHTHTRTHACTHTYSHKHTHSYTHTHTRVTHLGIGKYVSLRSNIR